MNKMEKENSIFSKVTISDIIARKQGRKISMLTCYDSSFAEILDKTDVDIILVGDSLANVVLGMERTKEVSFKEMLNHTKAVRGAVKRALVVADMPYVCYQKNRKKACYYAKKFMQEAGADAVKLEWFENVKEVTEELIRNKIPVMGHVGLTPQTVDKLGGFRLQGKKAQKALDMIKQAKLIERLGVFSIVIECVPQKVAKLITESVKVPTISIGAGKYCDGQVLVLYDLLGLYKKTTPKFVRVYADLYSVSLKAIEAFTRDVQSGDYPSKNESFSISDEEYEKLKALLKLKADS